MFAYIYQATITKAFTYLVSAIKYLEDSKDPFEAGDLIEVRESEEHAEARQLPAEVIANILSNIKDPEKIANLMKINRTWYREGSRRLNKDRDELMKWLRLNRIEQLDSFRRYLKRDRLDEYRGINNSIVNEIKEVKEHLFKLYKEQVIAEKNVNNYIDKYDIDNEIQPNEEDESEEEGNVFNILGLLQDDEGDEVDESDEADEGDVELIPPILYNYFNNERNEDDLIHIKDEIFGNLTFKSQHVPNYEELEKIYIDISKVIIDYEELVYDLNRQRRAFHNYIKTSLNRELDTMNFIIHEKSLLSFI